MIVDIPFAVEAVVRKHRARGTVRCLLMVERPFSVEEIAPEAFPLVGTCPRPGADGLFRAQIPWRAAKSGFWTSREGEPADVAATVVQEAAMRMHDGFVAAAHREGRLERLTLDQTAEIVSTNEDEILPALQRRLDGLWVVSGGRAWMRSRIPVLTEEMLAGTPGYSRRDGTPLCMFDLDLEALRSMYPGRSEASLLKAVPRIERPDLLAFDREDAVARHVASDAVAAFRGSQLRGVANPLSPVSALKRAVAAGAQAEELAELSRKVLDYGRSIGVPKMPVGSILELEKRHRSGPRIFETRRDGASAEASVRIDLAKFGAPGAFVDVDVPTADPRDNPVVAVYAEDAGPKTVAMLDGGDCILVPMVPPANTYGRMRTDRVGVGGEAEPGVASVEKAAADAVFRAMDWYGVRKPEGDPEAIAAAVADFVAEAFVSVDGVAHVRSGEPFFRLENSRVEIQGSRPGAQDALLHRTSARMVAVALGTAKWNTVGNYGFPVSLLDASALASLADFESGPSKHRSCRPRVEIMDPSRLSLRTDHLVAAFAGSFLLAEIDEKDLPRSLEATVSAAGAAVGEAFAEAPHRIGAAERTSILAGLTAFAEMVATDPRFSRLALNPKAVALTALLIPSEDVPALEADAPQGGGPIVSRDPEDGNAYDFGL